MPGDMLFENIEKEFEIPLDDLFNELINQQRTKVLHIARMHHPHLTEDDILNPHDFPELMRDPIFNYEEGLASGLLAAHIAVRARLLRPLKENANGKT